MGRLKIDERGLMKYVRGINALGLGSMENIRLSLMENNQKDVKSHYICHKGRTHSRGKLYFELFLLQKAIN